MKTAQPGFTLLELLVVLAIFAVFSLMAYGGLDSVLNTRRKVETALDVTADYQKAYMRLRNDFQQVRNRPARDGYGDAQPPLRWDRTSGNSRVEFTRAGWRNPLFQARSGLERVSYRLDGHKLMRESFRVLDQAQDSAVVSMMVLDNVDELKWEFLDPNREWKPAWPDDGADNQAAAPLAVQMTLSTKGLGQIVFLFRVGLDTVKLPASAAAGTGAPGSQPPIHDTPRPPAVQDSNDGDDNENPPQ